MKFREHRGHLTDSMKTLVEIKDRDALVNHLRYVFREFDAPLDFSLIRIEPYFMEPDVRIGWDHTYIVALPGYGVLGFTDEMPT
jgi:hypothetical protein